MPLKWIWTQWNEVVEETNTMNWIWAKHSPESKVTVINDFDGNEKIITMEIPLLDWSIYQVTWTLADIILIRKKLEFEWKIPLISSHDEGTKRDLHEMSDITRWDYWLGWTAPAVDTKAIWFKKKEDEEKKKKLIADIKQSIKNWRATIVNQSNKSKKALIEVFIVSEEKIIQFFSKKTLEKTWKALSKTWDIIGDIIEKWIYYAMPTIEWTLPHMKKKIYMTWKQLFDILSGKKIISNNDGKKEDIKHTDEVQ